jgi:Right handed beta helix region
MRVKTTLVAAALAGLMTMLLSESAAADVIKVSPSESIQAAIDRADPGDTIKLAPGTYQENVQIKTDDLTLKGAGEDETVIEPGTTPTPVDPFCLVGQGSNGICVTDVTPPADPNGPPTVNNRVANVNVKDLKVQNFSGAGVMFFGTRDQRVNDVVAKNNDEYGIAAFNTTRGRYWDNVANGNGEAGIYIGDSENANALVRDNVSFANRGFGLFIRDASHGVIEDNKTFDNCVGILFLETPEPTPAGDWVAHDNSANHNNADCPGEGGEPGVSGNGILIASASRITLVGNTANGNQPAQGSTTPVSGGIVVFSLPPEGPGAPEFIATDNEIKFNSAFGNQSVDILWDQKGVNEFKGNRCDRSDPDGLCAQGRHGNRDGDDGDDDDHHGHGHGNHYKHHNHHKHGHERD